MDEELAYSLTPEAFDALHGEQNSPLDEEEILLLRAVESWEALELGPITEEELVGLMTWYQQHLVDAELLKLFLRGDLHFAGMGDHPSEVSFALSYQGAQKVDPSLMEFPEL